MNRLPQIAGVEHQNDICSIELQLEPELPCFEGHFPGMPVLPGVIQLDWAIQLAKTHLNIAPQAVASQFEVLKFQQLLLPRQNVILELSLKGPLKVLFSYHSVNGKHASGRIVFENKA